MNSQKTLKEQCAQLLGWMKERRKPQSLGKDGFAVFAEDPLAEKQEQLSSYLKQVSRQQSFWEIKPEKWPAGRALLEASAEEKVQALRALWSVFCFGPRVKRSAVLNATAISSTSTS